MKSGKTCFSGSNSIIILVIPQLLKKCFLFKHHTDVGMKVVLIIRLFARLKQFKYSNG
jgi:hypothetical protein